MTSITRHRPSSTPSPTAFPRVRTALAAGAVLACLPYIALKTLWLAGSSVGIDQRLHDSGAMVVANTLTLAMELVGMALAIVLAGPRAWRLPSWLIGIPMYVGTGLLGGILLLLPIQAVLGAAGARPTAPDEPIEPWVYAIVYGAFAVLGFCLVALFALHAWERWVRPTWSWRLGTVPPLAPRARRVVIAHGAFMIAVCIAEALEMNRIGTAGGHQILALLASGCCFTGLSMLAVRRPQRLVASVPMSVAWVSSAIVAAWGCFFAVMLAVPNPLVGEQELPLTLVVIEALRAINGALTVRAIRGTLPATT